MKLKPPRIITVLIFTTITLVIWIIAGVIAVFKSDKVVDVAEEIRMPFDPALDIEQINAIEKSLYFSQNELVDTSLIQPIIEEEVIPTVTPNEELEAQPTETPNATQTPSPTETPITP